VMLLSSFSSCKKLEKDALGVVIVVVVVVVVVIMLRSFLQASRSKVLYKARTSFCKPDLATMVAVYMFVVVQLELRKRSGRIRNVSTTAMLRLYEVWMQ